MALLAAIQEEMTQQFGDGAAQNIINIISDNGFNDDEDSLLDDMKERNDSLLFDTSTVKADEFACVQRVCRKYSLQQQSKGDEMKDDSPPNANDIEIPNDLLSDAKVSENWKTKESETLKLYLQQCPLLVSNSQDASLMNIATLGRFHNNMPLISYCVDTFNRFRIEQFVRHGRKDVNSSKFVSELPFYGDLSSQQKMGHDKKFDIQTALDSYNKRWTPMLELEPTALFRDNIDDILRYIFAVSQLLHSFLVERKQDDLIGLPFQFDLVLIPKGGKKNVKTQFQRVDVAVDEDDDDEDDDEEEDEEDDDGAHGGAQPEQVAIDIKPGLAHLGIKTAEFEMQQKQLEDSTAAVLKRKIGEKLKQIDAERLGRYVMVVDRRDDAGDEKSGADDDQKNGSEKGKPKKPDKIYIFSPKCGAKNDYGRLHEDYLQESLQYKTLKCLIPTAKEDQDPHFGCQQHDCITLSFHVLAKNLVKCYLYINGTGSRFETTDLIELLPRFFEKSDGDLVSKEKVQQNFFLKLQDRQFEAWYKKTAAK